QLSHSFTLQLSHALTLPLSHSPTQLMAEEILKQRMPRLAKPEPAARVDVRLIHAVIQTEARFGRNEIKLGHYLNVASPLPRDLADFRAEPAQDALNLPLLVTLQDRTFGA